jgi:hypothetical protein
VKVQESPPVAIVTAESERASSMGDVQILQLFTGVRADCAVFYSTPHPPHF